MTLLIGGLIARHIMMNMSIEYGLGVMLNQMIGDAWLPASSFNRPVDFSSSSRYGRKRFHKTNVDEAHNPLPGVEKVKSSRKGKGVKQPRERPKTKRVHRATRAHPEIESKSRVKPVAEVAPCASPKDDTNIPSTIMPDAPLPSDVCILSSESDDDPKSPIHSVANTSTSRLQADLLKSTGRFSSPRMAIASHPTPPVQICNTFRLFLLNGSNIAFADPFAVDWLPSESVLNSASKSLLQKKIQMPVLLNLMVWVTLMFNL